MQLHLSPPPPHPLFFYISDPHVFHISQKKPDGKENIDIRRPSKFGNPYTVREYGRSKAIILFEINFIKEGLYKDKDFQGLKNKNLICSCRPRQCHGDVIAKYLYY